MKKLFDVSEKYINCKINKYFDKCTDFCQSSKIISNIMIFLFDLLYFLLWLQVKISSTFCSSGDSCTEMIIMLLINLKTAIYIKIIFTIITIVIDISYIIININCIITIRHTYLLRLYLWEMFTKKNIFLQTIERKKTLFISINLCFMIIIIIICSDILPIIIMTVTSQNSNFTKATIKLDIMAS